jgi:hypothetical protein
MSVLSLNLAASSWSSSGSSLAIRNATGSLSGIAELGILLFLFNGLVDVILKDLLKLFNRQFATGV